MQTMNKGMMVLVLFMLIVVALATTVSAMAEKGITESNVCYYGASVPDTDPYRSERCRLDVYHYAPTSNLPVVVWFHGGGLNSGS